MMSQPMPSVPRCNKSLVAGIWLSQVEKSSARVKNNMAVAANQRFSEGIFASAEVISKG